jgi:seryl-tRNA synthetase
VIDLKWLTAKSAEGVSNVDVYKKMLKDRGEDPGLADRIIELNEERKSNISNFESKKAEQNQASQKFAQAKKKGEAVDDLLKELQHLSHTVKELEAKSNEATEKIYNHLCFLPNILDEDTPFGLGEDDNKVFKEHGEKTELSFKAKEHWQLGEENRTIDFERAGKVSGSRFSYLRASGAKLERALIQFMLDKHVESDYEEIFPPLMVNAKALFGTSNFPKFQDDVFHIKNKDAFLVPTAEVPITNFYADEILEAEDLPQKFVAYTPCFRAEAGSYGKDTKGLIRQHQFNKVELVKFTRPEDSNEEHEKLLDSAESILKDLELHYQVVKLCSGDISFGAKKCFDINVWLPGQKAYREISSCSNFGDFQSRRANIRYRSAKGEKPQFIHTLNGSGLAAGRTLVAVYENYQQEDGSIKVPEVLVPYMNGQKIIKANK